MRKAVAACALLVLLTAPASAQSTNLALYQDLAVDCLGALPGDLDSFSLEGPERMPYVRSALISRWQDDGRSVFAADSSGDVAHLVYHIDDARVRYARQDGDVARRVALALRYTLTAPDGRILEDDRCAEEFSDVIPRGALAAVQNEAYAETQADAPEAGWFRRYLEPVVITAATAVAVYLFFTLRSNEADDS